MNKMLQLSSALSSINRTSEEVDGLIASFGLIRQTEGRNTTGRRSRRIERRRRRLH